MPSWAKAAIDAWAQAAGIEAGRILRAINKGDRITGQSMTPQAIFEAVRHYAREIGVEIAPHDCRRYAESRIMPNQCEGCAFGVELVTNVIN